MINKESSHPVIKKRLEIYDTIKPKIKIENDYDVVFNVKVKPNSLKKLKTITKEFVIKCLELEYKKKFTNKKKLFIFL